MPGVHVRHQHSQRTGERDNHRQLKGIDYIAGVDSF
jgi:hypothetical protein